MADEPEIIPPPEKAAAMVPNITINQFFQLVNQNSNFPDAETLGRYSLEDRNWIKQRVELEQGNRHQLLHKLVDNEHQVTLATTHQSHRSERERQYGAIAIIALSIIFSAVLVRLGFGYYALALPAVVMASPVAMNICNVVLKKIQGDGETDKPK
jgi:hypothetical protein